MVEQTQVATPEAPLPWGVVTVTGVDERLKRRRIGVLTSEVVAVTESCVLLDTFVVTHIPTGGCLAGDGRFELYFRRIEDALDFARGLSACPSEFPDKEFETFVRARIEEFKTKLGT